MKNLTFSHKFKTGRVIEMRLLRKRGHRPVFRATGCENLSEMEKIEYVLWRITAQAQILKLLTKNEVKLLAEVGRDRIVNDYLKLSPPKKNKT